LDNDGGIVWFGIFSDLLVWKCGRCSEGGVDYFVCLLLVVKEVDVYKGMIFEFVY
jgi:hypothetical protein